jgi:hypothetical protein
LQAVQAEDEDGQLWQLEGQARQNIEFEVSWYPFWQEEITVALEQVAAPEPQFLQEAVLESRYVPPEHAEHLEILLITTHVEHMYPQITQAEPLM